MRIEEERRIDRETKEKTKKKRECEQIVWKCIENAMRLSDKGERKKVRLETVRKKEEEWKKKNALRNEESTVKELSEILISEMRKKDEAREKEMRMWNEEENAIKERDNIELSRGGPNLVRKRTRSKRTKYKLVGKYQEQEK